ncbi:hypothetical protein [Desulfosporosinus fructosivorans]
MTSSFKRSFIGYDPVSVASELSCIDQEFVQKREELRRGLEIQVQQKETLLKEIEKLGQELAPKLSLQDDIFSRLLSAHLSGTGRVIAAIEDMKKKELDLTTLISERNKELLRLHIVLSEMSNEFLATATRYGTMLNWEEDGEANVKA